MAVGLAVAVVAALEARACRAVVPRASSAATTATATATSAAIGGGQLGNRKRRRSCWSSDGLRADTPSVCLHRVLVHTVYMLLASPQALQGKVEKLKKAQPSAGAARELQVGVGHGGSAVGRQTKPADRRGEVMGVMGQGACGGWMAGG